MMNIKLLTHNPALVSLVKDPEQIITLDANIIIPPDRSRFGRKAIDVNTYVNIWLDPLFRAFPDIAIHEAVYDEIVMPSLREYVDHLMNQNPVKLAIHYDHLLTGHEQALRNAIEERIAPLTSYSPAIDNKDDKGEVKSLAYIAVKGLLYFAAHDYNALQLIEKAEEWNTGLDNVKSVQIYELIYYLYKRKYGEPKALRNLYKYHYQVTENELRNNPKWGDFLKAMDQLYGGYTDRELQRDGGTVT